MKAVVFTEFGPPEVLRFVDVERPVPRRGELLIRVHATTVSAEDPKMRAADHPPLLWLPVGVLFGFRRPRVQILGMEFSGVVEAVGPGGGSFEPGDEVFGYTGIAMGAYATHVCVPSSSVLATKPPDVSHEQAAATPNGALTALVYLRNMGGIESGQRVLIYGASGSVGTAAVQLARYFGAEVTGVCSARNSQLVKSLGADRVLDYAVEDFTTDGRRYDIVFDTVGKTSWSRVRGSLTARGRYLVTVFGLGLILRMVWTWLRRGKRVVGGASNFSWTSADLKFLGGLLAAGKMTSVIDRSYPLSEVVEAHHYVETGRKRGNVVLTSSPPESRPPR